MSDVTLQEAVKKIVKAERGNTSAEHYLGKYDVALHVIFGTELYEGSGLCWKEANRQKRALS